MSEITNIDTPQTESAGDSAPENIKHNTGDASLPDLSHIQANDQASQNVLYSMQQMRERDWLKAEAYNASQNYDLNNWAYGQTLASDPRTKWLHDYKINNYRHRTQDQDMSRELSSTLATMYLEDKTKDRSRQLKELEALEIDAAALDPDDPVMRLVKQEKLSSMYYDSFANEKLPEGTLRALRSNPLTRTLSPQELNKVTDIAIKQNDFLRSLDEGNAFRYQSLEEWRKGESDLWTTRGGEVEQRKGELLSIIKDPKKAALLSREELIRYQDELTMLERLTGKRGFFTQLLDGINASMYSQFGTLPVDSMRDAMSGLGKDYEIGVGATKSESYGVANWVNAPKSESETPSLVEAMGYHELGVAALPQVIDASINYGVDPSIIMTDLYNSEDGQNFIKISAATNWGGLFLGGTGTAGTRLAVSTVSKGAASVMRRVIPKVLKKRVETAAAQATKEVAEGATGAAFDKVMRYKDIARSNLIDTGIGATANAIAMQVGEGYKRAAIDEVLNEYRTDKVDTRDSFMKGLTENALANIGMIALFSSPSIAINTHTLLSNHEKVERVAGIQKAMEDLQKAKVNREQIKVTVQAMQANREVPPNLGWRKSDLEDSVKAARAVGDDDVADSIENFMARHEDKLVNGDDATLAYYELDAEKAFVELIESPELIEELKSKVCTNRYDELQQTYIDDILDEVSKNIDSTVYKESELFNPVAKNERIKSNVQANLKQQLKGNIYNAVSDLRLHSLKTSEVDAYADRVSGFMYNMAQIVGVDPVEFVSKHNIKFELRKDVFDITDDTNIKDLGTFSADKDQLKITLHESSGLYNLTHETVHAMVEILFREEDAIRRSGNKSSIDVIDAIRKSYGVGDRKWSDLSPVEREMVQESIIGEYTRFILGDVVKGEILDEEKKFKIFGKVKKGIATDISRQFTELAKSRNTTSETLAVRKALEERKINLQSDQAVRELAAASQIEYEKQLKLSYDLSLKDVDDTNIKMIVGWIDGMYAEEALSMKLNQVLPLGDIRNTAKELQRLVDAGDFPPEAIGTINKVVEDLTDLTDEIEIVGKAKLGAMAPILLEKAEKVLASVDRETSKYGKVITLDTPIETPLGTRTFRSYQFEMSERRKKYDADVAAFNERTGVGAKELELAEAKKEHAEAIVGRKAVREKYVPKIQQLRDRKKELSAEVKSYKELVDLAVSDAKTRREEALAKANAKVTSLKEQLSNLKTEIAEYKKSHSDVEPPKEKTEKLAELESNIESYHKDVDAIRERYADIIAKKSVRKSELAKERMKFKKWITDAEKNNKKKTTEYQNTTDYEALKEDVERKIADIESDIADAREKKGAEIAAVNAKIKEARESIKATKQEIAEYKKANRVTEPTEEQQKKLDKLNKDLEAASADAKSIRDIKLSSEELIKRFGDIPIYKESSNRLKNSATELESTSEQIKNLSTESVKDRESTKSKHTETLDRIKGIKAEIEEIKAAHADEWVRLEEERKVLTSSEMRNISRYKTSTDAYVKAHIDTDALRKEVQAEFADLNSQIRTSYDTLKIMNDALDKDVVIDATDFIETMKGLNVPDIVLKENMAHLKEKGWVHWATDGEDPKNREVITVEDFAQRYAGGVPNALQMIQDISRFENDPEKYITGIVKKRAEQERKDFINPILEKAERDLSKKLLAVASDLYKKMFTSLYGSAKGAGRGAVITNLAKFRQHEVGKFSLHDMNTHELMQQARIHMRKGVKLLSNPDDFADALNHVAYAEFLLKANTEAIRVKQSLNRKIARLQKFLSKTEDARYKEHDRDIVITMELVAERAGIIKGKATWYKLTDEERAAHTERMRTLFTEELGKVAESADDYKSVYKVLTDTNFSGDIEHLSMAHAMTLLDTMIKAKDIAKQLKTADDEVRRAQREAVQAIALQSVDESISLNRRWTKNIGDERDGEIVNEQGIAQSSNNMTWTERVADSTRRMLGDLQKVPFLCNVLDGKEHGVIYDHVYKPVREGYDLKSAKRAELGARLSDAFKAVKKLDAKGPRKSDITIKVQASANGLAEKPLIKYYTFGTKGKFKGHPTMEAFMFLLNAGAPDNRYALAKAVGYKDPEMADQACKDLIKQMEATGLVTKEMLDEAQKIWDIFREVRSLTIPAHQEITGKRFKTVEGQKLKFDFGEYEGGYIPLSIEDRSITPMNGDSLSAAVAQSGDVLDGFTKERVLSSNVKYDLSIESLFNRLDQQLTYAYLAKPVIEADRFLTTNKDLANRLKAVDNCYDNVIKPWLLDVGTSGATRPRTSGTKFLNWFSGVTSAMVMAGNMVNALMNFANVTFVMARNSPMVLVRGATTYLTHKRFGGTVNNPTLRQSISQKSVFMSNRLAGNKNNYDRFIRKASGDGKAAYALGLVNDGAYILQSVLQMRLDMVVWSGVYDTQYRKLSKMHPDWDASRVEARAVELADDEVRKTQGSLDAIDSAAIERGSGLVKILTPFASFFIHQRNLIGTQWKLNQHDRNIWSRATKQLWLITMMLLGNGIASEYIRMLSNGDLSNNSDKEPEDLMADVGWALGKSTASLVHPVLGSAVSYFTDKARGEYTGNGMFATPALTWGESLYQVGAKTFEVAFEDGEWEDKDVNAFGKALAIGSPVLYNGSRYATTWYNISQGNYRDTDEFDKARAIITGKPSEDMKY